MSQTPYKDDFAPSLLSTASSPPFAPTSPSAASPPDGSDRETHLTLPLPSDALLSYARFGAPLHTSSHPPTIYLHGYPASRLEPSFLAPGLLSSNLTLLALDRPGYGYSTPDPDRTVLDHASDVLALADHLGIDKFAVMGVSGGGPYALACAAAIPTERLVSVGVVAGMGTYEMVRSPAVWKKLWWVNKVGFLGPVHFPRLYNWLYAPIVGFFARRILATDYEKLVASKAFQRQPESDKEFVLKGGRQGVEEMKDTAREAVRQEEWARWLVMDAECVLVRGWGFEIGGAMGIGREVRLWYGDKDRSTPVELGERIRDVLGTAEGEGKGVLHVVRGATHAGTVMEGVRILRDLVGVEKWVDEVEEGGEEDSGAKGDD